MIQQSHFLGHIARQNYNSKRHMHPYILSNTTHKTQNRETI